MPFNKYGETTEISIQKMESCIPEVDPEYLEQFRKTATELKRIAPKAEDFLYFTAVMMHAAEASAIHDDGTPKLNAKGEAVEVSWDKGNDSWKWISNDPSIKPYKNSNGDIFPEEELVKAYKKWIHKPLCIDHKSSSVDHVRGFIVDTRYDHNLKRVVALCALDKVSYPDLARKVSTGISNCVSMGTAVGRAICSDCGRVARAEQDFCSHMKTKSCYGEINVDLTPIELSIVLNGADQKATIKQVLAAANAMNTYIELKKAELNKLSSQFTASINFDVNSVGTNGTSDGSKVTVVNVNASDLETFKHDVEKAISDFQKLQSSLSEENNDDKSGNDLASNQSSGVSSTHENAPADSELNLQTPQAARFASDGGTNELHNVMIVIEAKINDIRQSLDHLTKASINKQEENMTGSNDINKKGYYQGPGGVNEPTPNQPKYPKDPLNEQLRDNEDKHMTGQPPFPEVGPVDGMHPSPASVDPSDELQRKKMLARAELEEKAIRRQAIVQAAKEALKNKEGYYLGGGGVNEPEPGKAKYPKDKLNEELREYEDKQMVGQPPFPGVGPVDGLHPSPSSADPKDELKRKEMLARANNTLTGRFIYATNDNGSRNLGKSGWEVFRGDKLLMFASVNDFSGGRPELHYDSIHTKEFGAQLLDRIKTQGADVVSKSLSKKAQVPPPPPPPPGGDAGGAPAPDAGAEPAPDLNTPDTGKSGDPKENALSLAEKVRDLSSDLVEAVRALTGEQVEMGKDEGTSAPAMADDASDDKFSTASLNSVRKQINGAICHAMKEAIAELNDHVKELDMIATLYDKGGVNESNNEFVTSIVDDAFNETKSAIADGFKLMTAFVKYARGTNALVKRAEIQNELEALASEEDTSKEDEHSADDLMSFINDTNSDLDTISDIMGIDHEEPHDEMSGEECHEHDELPNDANDIVEVKTPEEAAMVSQKNPDASVTVQAALKTKEGRAALRAKLAADALGKEDDGEVQDMSKQKFSDMLDKADSLADGQTELDVKPSGDLGLIETLPEINKSMLDVAKAPPKIRQAAEAINEMITEGTITPDDFDALVSQGLDKDAITYWKKYFGEVDGGSEFASELVKEHVKAQMEKELNKYKVKLAKAYELAHDMAARGLLDTSRGSIALQVEEIMQFDDPSFESLKKVVARHSVTSLHKEASRLPAVGFNNDDGEYQSPVIEDQDDYAGLSSQLGRKKGMF